MLEHVRLELGNVYGGRGKAWLDAQLRGYDRAARLWPWLVIRDLNGDAPGAAELARSLLPTPARFMVFRVAVRASEAWLLADRDRMARFLDVPVGRIPPAPDDVDDPKGMLVTIAGRSRRKAIREDMVPRPGTSARVGPGYTARIIEFANDSWRPKAAAARSPSLSRCIAALRRIGAP